MSPVAVETLGAAAPHFSLALTVPAGSELLFVAGLSARGEDGSVVGGDDAAAQTEEIYRKLEDVLAAAGGTLADLVRMDVFVRRAQDQPVVAAVRLRHATTVPPTSTMVVVAGFPDERYLVEITAVAAVPPRAPARRGSPPDLLRLADGDQVAIAMRDLRAGEDLGLGDGRRVSTTTVVPLGHKVAVTAVHEGEDVMKYGQPIGHATAAIAVGDHVHTHNLVGNRLAVETR